MEKWSQAAWTVYFREKHAELVQKVKMDRWHRYTVGDGRLRTVLPSVTTCLQMVPKPWLAPWTAKVQKQADRVVAIEVARAMVRSYMGDPTAEAFDTMAGAEFDSRLKAKSEADAQRDAAADLGTEIHALIEQDLRRRIGQDAPDPAVSDRAIDLWFPWKKWADEVELDPVAMEFPVYDVASNLAGTVDCLAYVRGRLTLLDWKSKKVYYEAHLQNVAYRMLATKMGLFHPAGFDYPGMDCEGMMVSIPKRADEEPICTETSVDLKLDEARWLAILQLNQAGRFIKDDQKATEGR